MAENLLASKQASKQAREYYIDVLKGLAMLAVILVHFNNGRHSPNSLLNKVSAVGARCPQLFFIISAYLTWTSLDRNPVNYGFFLKKKYSRMAPLFYAAIVIAVHIPTVRVFDISIGNYISHAFFVNGLNPLWYNSIIGVEWYIADLALFYILTPVLRKTITGLKSGIYFFCFSIALSSISLLLANSLLSKQIAMDKQFEMYFHTSLILHQLPTMTIGVILYYVTKGIKEGQLNRWKVLVESGIVTVLISSVFLVLHMNKKYMTSSLIAGLMFGCLFLFCGCISSNIWKKRVFNFVKCIGKHSYGIYCLHQIVINCICAFSHKNSSLLRWLAVFSAVAVISCGVGIGGEIIEEHTRIRIKIWYKNVIRERAAQ